MNESISNAINIFDMEARAKAKLPSMAYDYYAGGAHDEVTLRENVSAYGRLYLRNRVLVDVSKRDCSTTILGHKLSFPVLIAPTGIQAMAHEDGEIATAQGAQEKGTVMTLSTLSNYSLEEVATAAGNDAILWFQLYVHKDKATTKDLVQRAEAASYKALVLTVDLPLNGARERDIRNNLELPPGLTFKNLLPYASRTSRKDAAASVLTDYVEQLHDPSLTWEVIEWLRSITKLPVLVKGVMHSHDALLAYKHGASAVIVSNHGGRQLDTSPATIDVLPEIVEAMEGKFPILIDGGIRRGSDVIKALALGANAVLLGRPILWGLAVAGRHGVESVLDMFHKDIDLNMALCGCTNISDITTDVLWRRR